jgi:O-antigen ligase
VTVFTTPERLRGFRRLRHQWSLLAVPISLAAAWMLAARPQLVQLAALMVIALPLLVSPKARVLLILLGTVTVFGPPELNASKLLFLFGATVALVGAFAHSRAFAKTPAYADFRPILQASFALLVVVGLSLPVAQEAGVSSTEWLRDVAPYVLFAWAPLFAFDAQTAFGLRGLRRLIALVGLAGAAAYMVSWYGRRELASDTPGEFGLPTFLLGGALFAFAMAMTLEGKRRRLPWLVLGCLVLAMLATSGTRSSAVLLAAPFAIVVATRRHLARRTFRLAVAVPIAALLVGLGGHALFKLFDADTDVFSNRVEILFKTGTSSDDSYVDRLNQIEAAWELFRTSPLVGVGPGHEIQWSNSLGEPHADAFVDTPVGLLVDYGLLGVLAVVLFVVSFVSLLRRLGRRTGGRTIGQLGLIGFGAVILAYSVLQVPFEDKGLAAGLMLLLAVAVREARERPDDRELVDERPPTG